MLPAKIERRFHPRILVRWPATVRPFPDGSLEGEARDISVDGAFIKCSEMPELGEDFQIILKPAEQHSILVTAEKIWSGNINIDGKETYSGMGVRITGISAEDRQFIADLVETESRD